MEEKEEEMVRDGEGQAEWKEKDEEEVNGREEEEKKGRERMGRRKVDGRKWGGIVE